MTLLPASSAESRSEFGSEACLLTLVLTARKLCWMEVGVVRGEFAVSATCARVLHPLLPVGLVTLYELEGEESEAEPGSGNWIKGESDPCENLLMTSLRSTKDGRWVGSSCQQWSMMSYL